MDHDRKTAGIRIRLTEEEHAYLISQAKKSGSCFSSGRENLSKYLRDIIFRESRYKDWELKKELRNLNYELRKIGVNVNQIAHKINGNYWTADDLVALRNYLKSVEHHLEKLEKDVEEAWQSQS